MRSCSFNQLSNHGLFILRFRQQYIPFMGRGGGQDWRGGRGGRGGARGGYTPGVGRGNDPNAANMPQRTPPPNYICFRCGEKGKL
jgi:hypothetical protein